MKAETIQTPRCTRSVSEKPIFDALAEATQISVCLSHQAGVTCEHSEQAS